MVVSFVFSANQKAFVICTRVTSFALVLPVCTRVKEDCIPFSANQNWVIFSCILLVLKNCEILHFVWGLYDENSASYYCFTSDVMYKKYEMLVYTHPELLARFCWVNLSNAKIRPDLFSKNSFFRPNVLWSRAVMALKCDRRWLLFFGCIYTAINSM